MGIYFLISKDEEEGIWEKRREKRGKKVAKRRGKTGGGRRGKGGQNRKERKALCWSWPIILTIYMHIGLQAFLAKAFKKRFPGFQSGKNIFVRIIKQTKHSMTHMSSSSSRHSTKTTPPQNTTEPEQSQFYCTQHYTSHIRLTRNNKLKSQSRTYSFQHWLPNRA